MPLLSHTGVTARCARRAGRRAVHTRDNDHGCPWQEIAGEFTVDCCDFRERHYIEFVASGDPR